MKFILQQVVVFLIGFYGIGAVASFFQPVVPSLPPTPYIASAPIIFSWEVTLAWEKVRKLYPFEASSIRVLNIQESWNPKAGATTYNKSHIGITQLYLTYTRPARYSAESLLVHELRHVRQFRVGLWDHNQWEAWEKDAYQAQDEYLRRTKP